MWYFDQKADALDRKLLDKISSIFNKEKNNFYYPKEEILKYVKRSDKTHMNMLY